MDNDLIKNIDRLHTTTRGARGRTGTPKWTVL